jgi:hypothetical protein
MEAEIDHIVRMWRLIKGTAPEQEAGMRDVLTKVLADLPKQDDPKGPFIVGMKYLYRAQG